MGGSQDGIGHYRLSDFKRIHKEGERKNCVYIEVEETLQYKHE